MLVGAVRDDKFGKDAVADAKSFSELNEAIDRVWVRDGYSAAELKGIILEVTYACEVVALHKTPRFRSTFFEVLAKESDDEKRLQHIPDRFGLRDKVRELLNGEIETERMKGTVRF